jgi:hypothetical protein
MVASGVIASPNPISICRRTRAEATTKLDAYRGTNVLERRFGHASASR